MFGGMFGCMFGCMIGCLCVMYVGFVWVASSYFSAALSAVLCRCRQFVPLQIVQARPEEGGRGGRERGSLEAAGREIGAAWSVNINQSSKLKASDRRTQSGGNGDTDNAAAR